MASAADDAAYTSYVAAKLPWLRRVAYLLCQDWHLERHRRHGLQSRRERRVQPIYAGRHAVPPRPSTGRPALHGRHRRHRATHLTFSSDATAGNASQLQIEVVPAPVLTPSPQKPPIQTITVDGHTAYLETSPTSATLSVFGADGMTVVIQATGATAMADVNAVGGIIEYFHTLTLLGSDPKNWTTAVIG